jgi:hypothetical protein
MAKINIQHPLALLGRRVKGSEVFLGHTVHFDGVVECVSVQQGKGSRYSVEICVGGNFIDVDDCTALDFVLEC